MSTNTRAIEKLDTLAIDIYNNFCKQEGHWKLLEDIGYIKSLLESDEGVEVEDYRRVPMVGMIDNSFGEGVCPKCRNSVYDDSNKVKCKQCGTKLIWPTKEGVG